MAGAKDRITLRQDGTALEITIQAKRHLFKTGFLLVWQTGWAFGWVAATVALFTVPIGFITFFLLFWLTFWTYGGLIAGKALAWMLAGREVIRVSDDGFVISRCIPFHTKTRHAAMAHVTGLRLDSGADQHQASAQGFWTHPRAGTLHVLTHDAELGFAIEVAPEQAKRLRATLQEVFPKLAEDAN